MSLSAERYIFEIPIYWRDEKAFTVQYDTALKAHGRDVETRTRNSPNKETARLLEIEFAKRYVAPWRYNQTVGWIQLYVRNSRLRADEWFTQAKKFDRRMKNKNMSLTGKVFEVACRPEESSGQIFRAVLAELLEYQSQSQRKIVLDLYCFEGVGPFVDWRGLVDGCEA